LDLNDVQTERRFDQITQPTGGQVESCLFEWLHHAATGEESQVAPLRGSGSVLGVSLGQGGKVLAGAHTRKHLSGGGTDFRFLLCGGFRREGKEYVPSMDARLRGEALVFVLGVEVGHVLGRDLYFGLKVRGWVGNVGEFDPFRLAE